jgi:hypothetical protein
VRAAWRISQTRCGAIRHIVRTIKTVAFSTEAVSTHPLALGDASGREVALTNWSFEQLAGMAGVQWPSRTR